MTKRTLTSFLIKIAAVYVFFQFLPFIINEILFILYSIKLASYNVKEFQNLALCYPLFWLILSFILFMLSNKIATKIIPEDNEIGNIPKLNSDEILRIIIVAIGINLLIITAPVIFQVTTDYLLFKNKDNSFSDSLNVNRLNLIKSVIRLFVSIILGYILISRPRKILAIIKKLQLKDKQSSESVNLNKNGD